MRLTNNDIKIIANKYNLHPAAIKAVINVESTGHGFYTNEGKFKGDILCRFEGHWFHKFTNGIYDKSHPELSYSNWRLGYRYARKGQDEFGRFIEAFNLDKEAAWKSTSWGLFQIMGFNYGVCGYSSVKDMLEDYYKRGEIAMLESFIKYCENKKILDFLRNYKWSNFAHRYNGSGYKVNKYHTRLSNQFNYWKDRL